MATLAPSEAPTVAPTLPPTLEPTPSPVVLKGTGETATDPRQLPALISVATFTHSGRSNFAVETFRGGKLLDVLVSKIEVYTGSRPLTGVDPIILNIEADGAWTVTVAPIQWCASSGAFTGKGDMTSTQFNSPTAVAWEFAHDGKSNFAVLLHCGTDGRLRDVVQNRIGVFQGSAIVVIPPGPGFWEVEADGNWSLKLR